MQLNPARGRKHETRDFDMYTTVNIWFMQLNPARGRKLNKKHVSPTGEVTVYAAQPREGTETF